MKRASPPMLIAGSLLAGSSSFGEAQRPSLPTAEWMGVERIVVACDPGTAAEASLLCGIVTEEASRVSGYPVVRQAQADLPPGRHDLLLRVVAQPHEGGEEGHPALSVSLRLVRSMLRREADAAPPRSVVLGAHPPALAAGLRPVLADMLKPPTNDMRHPHINPIQPK